MPLSSDGALDISTPAGGIRWKKPVVYQWKDGVRQPVAGAFALRGRRVTFAIGAYDRSSDLVIDPTLTYATYLGGNDNDTSHGVAVDASGNIYVTGFTFSMNLATAAGSYQSTYHGGTYQADTGGDAFVAKYSSRGNVRVTSRRISPSIRARMSRYAVSCGPSPSSTASSASCTWRAAPSASAYTATAFMPSRRTVRMTRRALSPRSATRTVSYTFPSLPTSSSRIRARWSAPATT